MNNHSISYLIPDFVLCFFDWVVAVGVGVAVAVAGQVMHMNKYFDVHAVSFVYMRLDAADRVLNCAADRVQYYRDGNLGIERNLGVVQ